MDTPAKASKQLLVHWDKCQANLLSSFEKLFNSSKFVDVTLSVESQMIKCHKVVLSASSPYFEKVLADNPCPHPIIIIRGMKYWEVLALVHFMYRGEVNIEEKNLEVLLKSAEALQIRGLSTDATTYHAVKLSKSLGIKGSNVSRVESEMNVPVQSAQLSNKTETQTIALQSDIINTKISAKFKKACYRNNLPSFNTTVNADTNAGVVSDTPLVQLGKSSENVMIKEEIDMDFVNTDDVPITPSVEYGVLQGEDVSLEGTLSQIVASDPGPSSSLESKVFDGSLPDLPQPTGPLKRKSVAHVPTKIKEKQKSGKKLKNKRCRVCSAYGIVKRVIWHCLQCDTQPGLCVPNCFDKFHE